MWNGQFDSITFLFLQSIHTAKFIKHLDDTRIVEQRATRKRVARAGKFSLLDNSFILI